MPVPDDSHCAARAVDVEDLIAVHDTVWSVHVLHIFGDIDLTNAAALEREIETTASAPRVVIDLSDCNYLDRTAMRVLAHALQTRGDALRIVSPRALAPQRAVRIAQMEALLHLFPSFPAAMQW